MQSQDYSSWEEVPEEMIAQAAELADKMGGLAEPDNINFKKILLAGTIFKNAGLTPVYVWEEHSHRLAVYAQELYGKKLH